MRNSSSLDWLRFMHTPNDYRVSRIFLELKCFLPQITQIEIRFIAYFNLYLC